MKELTPHFSEDLFPATFDEFKKRISEHIEANGIFDKVSYIYDKIP